MAPNNFFFHYVRLLVLHVVPALAFGLVKYSLPRVELWYSMEGCAINYKESLVTAALILSSLY